MHFMDLDLLLRTQSRNRNDPKATDKTDVEKKHSVKKEELL